MTSSAEWQRMFLEWPASIQRRGIVTTVLDEQIPFKGFMTTDKMLLLERANPDQLGARFIVLEYSAVAALKYIDPLRPDNFTGLGFVGKFSS